MKRSIDDSTAPITKPVFLTKAQRELLALEHRYLQVTGHRRNQEDLFFSTNNHPSDSDRRDHDPDDDIDMESYIDRERDRDREREKRVIKPIVKVRFSFDWENTEDDMNYLYQNPHEAQLLFDRGFRGGMDRREHKKLAANNEKDGIGKIQKILGVMSIE